MTYTVPHVWFTQKYHDVVHPEPDEGQAKQRLKARPRTSYQAEIYSAFYKSGRVKYNCRPIKHQEAPEQIREQPDPRTNPGQERRRTAAPPRPRERDDTDCPNPSAE